MEYKTKVIDFFGRNRTIFLQNDNGPCPLLAICNALSLKNRLDCNTDVSVVSHEALLTQVVNRILTWNASSSDNDDTFNDNQERNIADVMDLIPRLATGLDVNVKFRRIDDFEFTPECALFDLLGIPLYHGWIPTPNQKAAEVIGSKSYNVLMQELVNEENSVPKAELDVIRNFMDGTASQLTPYGLFRLQRDVEDDQICVFFRNNHFNTMFKYEGELYVLATDQGYQDHADLVWERLNGVNGDTTFMTGKFKKFKYVQVNDDNMDSSATTSGHGDEHNVWDNAIRPRWESRFDVGPPLATLGDHQRLNERGQSRFDMGPPLATLGDHQRLNERGQSRFDMGPPLATLGDYPQLNVRGQSRFDAGASAGLRKRRNGKSNKDNTKQNGKLIRMEMDRLRNIK